MTAKSVALLALLMVASGCSVPLEPIIPPDLAGSWAAVPVAAVRGGAAGLRLEFSVGQNADGKAAGTGKVGYYQESSTGVRTWWTYHSVNLSLGYDKGVVTLEYATPTCGAGDTSCRGSIAASYDPAVGITGTMTGIYATSGPRTVEVRRCPDSGLVVCWQ